MNYLDVCSGLSAPTVAWKPLGWQAVAVAMLQHHREIKSDE